MPRDMPHGNTRKQQFHAARGWRCWYCGSDLSTARTYTEMAAIEHLIPKSRGGRSTAPNLVSACIACNLRKRNRTLEEYRTYLRLQQDAAQARAQLLKVIGTTKGPMPLSVSHAVHWLEGLITPVIFWGEA